MSIKPASTVRRRDWRQRTVAVIVAAVALLPVGARAAEDVPFRASRFAPGNLERDDGVVVATTSSELDDLYAALGGATDHLAVDIGREVLLAITFTLGNGCDIELLRVDVEPALLTIRHSLGFGEPVACTAKVTHYIFLVVIPAEALPQEAGAELVLTTDGEHDTVRFPISQALAATGMPDTRALAALAFGLAGLGLILTRSRRPT